MKSSLKRISNVRGVLDLISLALQTQVVRGPRSLMVRLRVKVRSRDPDLLQGEEEDSLVYQWVVLQVQLHGDQPHL